MVCLAGRENESRLFERLDNFNPNTEIPSNVQYLLTHRKKTLNRKLEFDCDRNRPTRSSSQPPAGSVPTKLPDRHYRGSYLLQAAWIELGLVYNFDGNLQENRNHFSVRAIGEFPSHRKERRCAVLGHKQTRRLRQTTTLPLFLWVHAWRVSPWRNYPCRSFL